MIYTVAVLPNVKGTYYAFSDFLHLHFLLQAKPTFSAAYKQTTEYIYVQLLVHIDVDK